MGGDFNMPPGVSVRDIPGFFDEDISTPHCSHCGGFISKTPSRKVEIKTLEYCDGKKKEWKHDYDESLVAILGEEYRGKEYSSYHFSCSHEECDENTSDHEPHWFEFDELVQFQSLCRHCCRYVTIDEDGFGF